MVLDFGLADTPKNTKKSFNISNHKLRGIKLSRNIRKPRRASYHDYVHDSDSSSSSSSDDDDDDNSFGDFDLESSFSEKTTISTSTPGAALKHQRRKRTASSREGAIAGSATKVSAALSSALEFEAVEDEIVAEYEEKKQALQQRKQQILYAQQKRC